MDAVLGCVPFAGREADRALLDLRARISAIK